MVDNGQIMADSWLILVKNASEIVSDGELMADWWWIMLSIMVNGGH